MRDVWNCAKNLCRFRIVSHAAVTCTVISPLVLNDWVTFFVRILQNKGPAHHKRYTGMLSRKVCYKSPLTPCKRLCTELHSKSCGGSFQTPAFEKESIPLIWVLLFSNSVFVCLFVCLFVFLQSVCTIKEREWPRVTGRGMEWFYRSLWPCHLFTASQCCCCCCLHNTFVVYSPFPLQYSCANCPVHVFRVYIPSCVVVVVVVVYITLSLLSTHLIDLHSTLFYIPSCCCCCLHNTPLVYSIQQAEMIAAKNALSSSKLPLTILQRHCKSTRFVEGEVKSEWSLLVELRIFMMNIWNIIFLNKFYSVKLKI